MRLRDPLSELDIPTFTKQFKIYEEVLMSQTANCVFKINGWDEKTAHEFDDGSKITHVAVKKEYSGDIEAEGLLEYVMIYRVDGVVEYSGYERITGTLHGKSGSFVIEDRGQFDQGVANSDLTIISGTGADELSGLSGGGSYSLGHAEEHPLTINYQL
jgi:hypothetical protein